MFKVLIPAISTATPPPRLSAISLRQSSKPLAGSRLHRRSRFLYKESPIYRVRKFSSMIDNFQQFTLRQSNVKHSAFLTGLDAVPNHAKMVLHIGLI